MSLPAGRKCAHGRQGPTGNGHGRRIGTGRAIALALARQAPRSWYVTLMTLGREKPLPLASPGRCWSEVVDVTVSDQVGRLIRDVQPQILVNNAGGGGLPRTLAQV